MFVVDDLRMGYEKVESIQSRKHVRLDRQSAMVVLDLR